MTSQANKTFKLKPAIKHEVERELWGRAAAHDARTVSEAFRAAIQSAQTVGLFEWLAADGAALDYIAMRIAPKFGDSSEVFAKRITGGKLWPPQ